MDIFSDKPRNRGYSMTEPAVVFPSRNKNEGTPSDE